MNDGRNGIVYAFDVLDRGGNVFLANKRVFAYAIDGIPTGIECDHIGNVYLGCGDGLEIWSPGGGLMGVVEVPGTYRFPPRTGAAC